MNISNKKQIGRTGCKINKRTRIDKNNQNNGLRQYQNWNFVDTDLIISFQRRMFPINYTYNPGVVLDPVTMAPMITHGGNITVNPLGVPMRPEQKIWQKMFIKNIPQECTNQIMTRLLNEFGAIKNFKRALDNRGTYLPFCHFDLETGEQIMRIKRLFSNIRLLDNELQIKISTETQNFIKEWTTMQKDEWRKKLLAPGMNEAKQYESIEVYHTREDKRYKQKIEQTLKQINVELRKLAAQRRREEERKEHPKEKERQKARKRAVEELERNFSQKQQNWLRHERQKEKEYRKEKERQRERQRQRSKRLEKQLSLDDEEISRRLTKYFTKERRAQIQAEEDEDVEVMMEENPPLPEEQVQAEKRQNAKKARVVVEEEIILGEQKVEDVLVQAPRAIQQQNMRPRQLQRNQLFEGYQAIYQENVRQQPLELNIPQINPEHVDEEEEKRKKIEIAKIQQRVPNNKMDLWEFPIDWEKLAKSVVLQRNIRPWLQEMSNHYIGCVEERFIAVVQKKLLSKSHPDKIIKILKQLLDDDSQQFVIRLWKKLVLEFLKLQEGLI